MRRSLMSGRPRADRGPEPRVTSGYVIRARALMRGLSTGGDVDGQLGEALSRTRLLRAGLLRTRLLPRLGRPRDALQPP